MKKPKYRKNWEIEHKEEKKKKISKEFLWTLFITLIMVSSIIGFMWIGEDEEPGFTYKDKYKFIRRNNAFVYKENNMEFTFRFFPTELEETAKEADISKLKQPMFYITFDPESELIQTIELLRFELSNELPKLNVYMGQGVTEESDVYNLTIIDCGDATADAPVVKFVKSNETKIEEENNCFVFKAKSDYDLAKLKDVLLYTLLGIL